MAAYRPSSGPILPRSLLAATVLGGALLAGAPVHGQDAPRSPIGQDRLTDDRPLTERPSLTDDLRLNATSGDALAPFGRTGSLASGEIGDRDIRDGGLATTARSPIETDAEANEEDDGADREDESAATGFDIFAGPSSQPAPNRAPTASASDPASPEQAGEAEPRTVEASQSLPGGRDPLATGAVAPLPGDAAGPAARQNPRAQTFANAPLLPGISGEALPVDSLLRTVSPAQAIERIVRPAEADPFAPVGLRAGSVLIYPELTQRLGLSSNLEREAGGKGGAFSETSLEMRALTDWARHGAELNARLTYRRNFAGREKDDPEAAVDGRIDLDLGALTSATLRGALSYRRENELDPVVDVGGATRPEILTSSLGGEISHEFGLGTLTGGATLAREHYLSNAPGIPDLSYTTATANLRAGYDLSPALSPFVEGSLGKRIFDDENRIGGDATISSIRTGLAVDIAQKLRGEVGLGYAWNAPESGETSSAPTIDANLTWSPRRGTDIVLAARTAFSPEAGGGSSIDYETSIALLHAVNNHLDLNGSVRAIVETADDLPAVSFQGSDPFGLAAEAGFTYWINRSLSLVGLYEYERRYEALDENDWSANTVSLGVRMRR
ncbi:hypothetical protein DYI37_03800 [Fulvimarina endophytica]|uniref:Outer membrane beta-barrel protein n=1 Tax=Fulvimarina endophytica TaxID=2293836 RepID=A0A371X6Z7_9HYPH|nr:outer membrane beta-barrel protein [Fulvimarina endophytica]RFC65000.1 hypothetical protein DYI37_03800 [Fulvimarina endophytica]